MKNAIESAYEAGVKQALFEKTAFIPEAIGGLVAPEGEGWRGASGAGLGAGLGSIAGGVGGGLLGAGLGSITGEPSHAALGAVLGGGLGLLGGGIYGGVKGYRASVLSPEERAILMHAKLKSMRVA